MSDYNAEFYDQFYGPLFFEPYALEVAKRIDPAVVGIALEIAAGTGRVTRHIRARLAPSATLIASDISDDMLDEAKKNLGELAIEWQHIDAQELPFDSNTLDLVVCCFGYMFVADRPKAFAEAFRVLRPGGMLICTTWDSLEKNPASFIASSISKEYLQASVTSTANLATSMNDESLLQSLLQEAGFSNTSIEKVEKHSVSPTAKEAARGLVKGGPYYEQLKNERPGSIEEVKAKVEKELAEKYGAAPMVAPISALVCQAWK